MPAAIPALAGLGTAASIGIQIGTMVVLNVLSRKLQDRGNRPLSKHPNNQREMTVRATDAYENFVYGKSMVGGITVFQNATTVATSGSTTPNNRYVHVVKWAGHRVNCLEYFRFDNRYLNPASDTIGWDSVNYIGQGEVQTGVFRGTPSMANVFPTRLRWYPGSQPSADLWMRHYFNLDWTAAAVGRERAYGVHEVQQIDEGSATDNVWQNGVAQDVFAYVHGKSVYDHRRYALNGNPKFLNTQSYWYETLQGEVTVTASTQLTSINASHYVSGVGGTTDRAYRTDGIGRQFASELIPIPVYSGALNTFTLIARARQTGGTSVNYLAVAFYTAAGSHIAAYTGSHDATGWDGFGTFHYWSVVNGTFPSVWSTFAFTVGSGFNGSIPSSARYMRVGALACYSNDGVTRVEIQELRAHWGHTSAHLVDVASTWAFSQNPVWCGADYLRNEVFGFGKESRQPVNASRYALNADPCWRRLNTLTAASYWNTAIHSGIGSPISSFGSLTTVADGPVGRRALVMVASAGSPFAGEFIASNLFPVDPEGVYTVSGFAKFSGPRQVRFDLAWVFASGAWFTSTVWHTGTGTQPWSNFVASFGSGTGNAIPSSARFASVVVQVPRSWGLNTTSELYLQEFMVQPGTTIKRFIEPWEQIVWTSMNSAASWCDGGVSTPSGTQARFQSNGQGHTGRSYRENLKDILAAGNLRATYTQSGWMFFGGWSQPDLTLNNADYVSGVQARGSAETGDRHSGVRCSFYDRHQDGKLVPGATVTAGEYIARDNSMQLFEDVQLDYTDDWWMAQRVQFGLLEQADNQVIVQTRFGWKGFLIQPGRHIAVKNNVLSWSPKYFMPTEVEYDIPLGVAVTMREDFQASYIDPTSAEYVPRSGPSITSMAPHVPFVSSVAVQYLGRDGTRLTWVNPANRAFEWIDVYKLVALVGSFGLATLWKSTKNSEVADPNPFNNTSGVRAQYWFRTRDFMGNVSSPWPDSVVTSYFVTATVPAPASLTATYLGREGVRLKWVNPTSSPFFEWVEVYRENDPDFSSTTPIKLTRADEWTDVDPFLNVPGALAYYWVRNRDYVGNVSALHPNSAVTVTPSVPFISGFSGVYMGRDGVRMSWTNPSTSSAFEWVDIYRHTINNAGGAFLLKTTRNSEFVDPDPFSGTAGRAAYYFIRTRDWVGNATTASMMLNVATPAPSFVSSVVVTPRVEGVQLRWVNPSDNRFFEWIDIYRQETTNAFSGSTLIKSTRNDEYLDPMIVGDNFKTWHYWFRTRDWVGNQSSVYPGLTTSFSANPLPAIARDPEYVFLEEFNYSNLAQFSEKWRHTSSLGLITFVMSGNFGGFNIMVSSGEARFISRTKIPYDPNVLYQLSADVKVVTSAELLRSRVFLGCAAYGADGVTPLNFNGNSADGFVHGFASNAKTINSIGVWQKIVGHLQGHMAEPLSGSLFSNLTEDPKFAGRLRDGVKYIAPAFTLCFSGSSPAVQALDYISIKKVVPVGLVYDGKFLADSGWLYGTGSSYAAISRVAINGEYNTLILPSSQFTTVGFLEKVRPDFHRVAPQSYTMTVNGRIWVGSHNFTGDQLGARIGFWTRTGSLAGVVDTGAAISNPAEEQWLDFTIPQFTMVPSFFLSAAAITSYPPPWFMTVGLYMSTQDVQSLYVANLDAYLN